MECLQCGAKTDAFVISVVYIHALHSDDYDNQFINLRISILAFLLWIVSIGDSVRLVWGTLLALFISSLRSPNQSVALMSHIVIDICLILPIY
jgi:hypothetical protein